MRGICGGLRRIEINGAAGGVKAAIVIPARYASTRLPGKPLLAETGKPLIRHVCEQAARVRGAARVIVATDDARIASAVTAFGGEAVMTSADCQSGTARVAEAAAGLDADVIVNLQGDEPEIDPSDLDLLIDIQARGASFASTLACRFPRTAVAGPGSPDDPSAVKAILGETLAPGVWRARYFTRRLCAYPRDESGAIKTPQDYYLHLGVYAFSRDSLAAFASAPCGALEASERLEQLRILEMGESIAVGEVRAAAPGIDTPEDYAAFVERCRGRRGDPGAA